MHEVTAVCLGRLPGVQVVTWGHPCCFDRVRRRPGRPDENRVWFRPTIDLCRDDWLILHKIECAPRLAGSRRAPLACACAAESRDSRRLPS